MYDIHNTLDGNWIFALIILVAIFLSLFSLMPIFSLFSKNRKKEINKNIYYLENELNIKKPILIISCLVCTFVLIFSNSVIVWTLDGKTDLRLAPEGVHFYSVIINREGSSSHYTLPAKILKSEGLYYVENVYFSNGGYLYFNSYEYADFDETITDADQNGEFWEIKITNLKASPPNNMADHYEISFWRLFFVIVPSILIVIYALLLLFTKNKKYSEENTNLQIEKYISSLKQTYQNAVRDIGDVKPEDIEHAYTQGLITKEKFTEIMNSYEVLQFMIQSLPLQIETFEQKRLELLNK